jgi:hypothetical protein
MVRNSDRQPDHAELRDEADTHEAEGELTAPLNS